MERKVEWPEVGDFVIATIQKITDYGAYVMLDEYNKQGLLHVSEVSSGWVRNIRDFVREGQKTVLRVLRVNAEKGHVDLSLKRVSRSEKREKVMFWKKERKADGLLRSVSETLKIPIDEVYEKAGTLIENKFGGLYEGLERTAREGPAVLLATGVPENLATAIAEVAKERIKISLVKIKGTLQLQSMKPNGVILLREALLSAQEVEKPQEANVRVYTVSPPKYRIEISAEDYKIAEKVLDEAVQRTLRSITKSGGQGTFQREK